MESSEVQSKIYVALDFADPQAAIALAQRLDPQQCGVKVGKELFTTAGPDLVKHLVAQGFDVFLDLKFHDIPNTVQKAVLAAAKLGVAMVNVHASGGLQMMQYAKQALDDFAKHENKKRPLLIAVTVLTSTSDAELAEQGITESAAQRVTRLARLTQQAGLDGVVCSAQEAAELKRVCGDAFVLVTPGIRPAGSDKNDQKRTMTPAEAQALGVDYLVIGRPITQAADPLTALTNIRQSLA